jgi:hypothetical protein
VRSCAPVAALLFPWSLCTLQAAHMPACVLCVICVLQGSEEQQSSLLPGMAANDLVGCWSLTEPSNGSDASALTCRCVSWILQQQDQQQQQLDAGWAGPLKCSIGAQGQQQLARVCGACWSLCPGYGSRVGPLLSPLHLGAGQLIRHPALHRFHAH